MRGFDERCPVRADGQGACGTVVGTLVDVSTGFGPKGTTFLDAWLTMLWPVPYGVYLYGRGRSA